MGIRKGILPIVFSIILISGTTPAFAGGASPPPPLLNPEPGFEDNYVHGCWDDIGTSPTGPTCGYNADSTGPPIQWSFVNPSASCDTGSCEIRFPNWIDDLPFKDIKIIVSYENPQGVADTPPSNPSVVCHDSSGTSSGQYVMTMPSTGAVMWFFECYPNPDYEDILFFYDPQITTILGIEIWTTSYDEPISGIGIPIDTTALLLASAQSISLWMIPVVLSGIGIGVFVIKRKN